MTCCDPRTGTLWVGSISFAGSGGIFVARKDPGANTFQPAVMARRTGGADKGWMGRTVFIQAVERSTCTPSNVMKVVFN